MQGFVAKIRTVKISSGASSGVFAKVCIRKSFPLYGTSISLCLHYVDGTEINGERNVTICGLPDTVE